MSVPIIPEVTQEQALIDLLESIAVEETALAHLINAEAEKVQVIAEMLLTQQVDTNGTINFQKSINRMMQTIIKKEIILQFKLENVLDAMKEIKIIVHKNTVTATGIFNNVVYSDTDVAYYSYKKEQDINNPTNVQGGE
ncbi:hypothetical protein SYNTR_1578 [Candidatus Syntrophocurvum alkaliphilum]|uniref:Uncharacterized protein n=1 Tax=Candidatus Syntrophocurvum alkaliphilum TaxID=2293317 RepID=A0A6I6DM54_9FIRM|nr:hypothetical protein [Candidatus Syntrophocurvum alkaliphilum]QGU00172.1 hypothetical protein SYNTR_1578 [Candidatus Syntrophocurvum alkaliphilum]